MVQSASISVLPKSNTSSIAGSSWVAVHELCWRTAFRGAIGPNEAWGWTDDERKLFPGVLRPCDMISLLSVLFWRVMV